MIRRILIAAMLSLAWATMAHAAACDAPPPQLHPGAQGSVSISMRAFAGTWQGQWPILARGAVLPLCAKLYVLVTGSGSATVEQCTGSNKTANRKPECKQFAAQITGDQMTFTDLEGTVYTFTMADVGGMKGEAVSAQHRSVTVFTKAP